MESEYMYLLSVSQCQNSENEIWHRDEGDSTFTLTEDSGHGA